MCANSAEIVGKHFGSDRLWVHRGEGLPETKDYGWQSSYRVYGKYLPDPLKPALEATLNELAPIMNDAKFADGHRVSRRQGEGYYASPYIEAPPAVLDPLKAYVDAEEAFRTKVREVWTLDLTKARGDATSAWDSA